VQRKNEKPLTVARQGFGGAISFAPDLRTKRASQIVSRIMTRFDFDLDRAVRACRQHCSVFPSAPNGAVHVTRGARRVKPREASYCELV